MEAELPEAVEYTLDWLIAVASKAPLAVPIPGRGA
jgi:hypothetical protein